MSKIICDVCGTSYPEVSTQCPICGCVRPADAQGVLDNDSQRSGTYQYVKGGRFSKANVRKRNANAQPASRSASGSGSKTTAQKQSKDKDSGNTGLVITIIVLILAIIAVAGYMVVKFFLPMAGNDAPGAETTGQVETVPPTELEVLCTALEVEPVDVTLREIGEQVALNVVLTPADTTEKVTYSSDDTAVAVVDEEGLITAVGFGDAVITVTCGSITEECVVSVAEPFLLDEGSIILEGVGATRIIYSGDIAATDITWSTDDDSVAIILDGVVVAVGSGETTVYGEYNGEIASCSVTCEVMEETGPETTVPEETEEPTEGSSSGSNSGTYSLKNLYGGSNSDVTMTVGTTFVLELKDANGNTISGVTWSVEGGSCCTVDDGTVTAVASGTATVVAAYNGETYKCIVRVA